MTWNEKVDLVKKMFSSDDFFVPHANRKEILRKIETKFISRREDYYDLNNHNERFCNWWDGVDTPEEILLLNKKNRLKEIEQLITDNEKLWLAVEFQDGIKIYKTSKAAAIYVISIGLTWSNTYHLVQLKYDHLMSIKILDKEMRIKRK